MRQIESTPYDAFAVGDIDARPPRGASNVLLRYGDLTSGNAPYSQSPGSASRPPSPGGTQALNVSLEHCLVRLATNEAARGAIRFGVRTALGYERTQRGIVVSNCAALHDSVTSAVTCPTRPRHLQAAIRSTKVALAHLWPSPAVAVTRTPNSAPTGPCLTPQHHQATAWWTRSPPLAQARPTASCWTHGTERNGAAGVTSVGNVVNPGSGTRTVSVSVCNGAIHRR
jgi:hypothetical protein